jgi:hypothetical protein
MGRPTDVGVKGIFGRYGIERNIRSSGRLDLFLRCLIRLLRGIREEAMSRTGLPLRHRLRALRLGLRSGNAALYQLDEGCPSRYVPDYAYAWRCYAMNGFLNPIVGNKLVVSQILAANGISCPYVFGVVSKGSPLPLGSTAAGAGASLLLQWTESERPVVFRPHWSGAGEGVFFLRRAHREWFINGRAAPEADVLKLIEGLDRYIATAFVDQATYARDIYPETSNTLRVLALTDAEGPFVASVVHRFGTTRSFPIDNFHQGRGGICASVDAAAQRLGKAVSLDKNKRREWHGTHPQTGAPIEGVPIPGLSLGLEGVLAAMRCFPEAVCVGWDLLMTDGGFSILEANAPPGLAVSQAHAPLLADPRTARFFAAHGIHAPAAGGS